VVAVLQMVVHHAQAAWLAAGGGHWSRALHCEHTLHCPVQVLLLLLAVASTVHLY